MHGSLKNLQEWVHPRYEIHPLQKACKACIIVFVSPLLRPKAQRASRLRPKFQVSHIPAWILGPHEPLSCSPTQCQPNTIWYILHCSSRSGSQKLALSKLDSSQSLRCLLEHTYVLHVLQPLQARIRNGLAEVASDKVVLETRDWQRPRNHANRHARMRNQYFNIVKLQLG